MAATFLQAFVERYDQLSGLPDLFFDENPEQKSYPRAQGFHGGQVPVAGSWDVTAGLPALSDDDISVLFSAVGLVAVEALAKILMQGMQPTSLNYDVDPDLRIWRTMYKVAGSTDRDPVGNKVFTALITWHAQFGTDY